MGATIYVTINDLHTTMYDWDDTKKDLKEIFIDIAEDIDRLTNSNKPVSISIQIER